MHDPSHWIVRLIAFIEAINDHERWRFFTAWEAAEGGSAQWNPLNTTLDLGPTYVLSNYNKSGVKNYRWALAGLAATALTLGGRNDDGSYVYPLLWQHLRDEDVTAEQIVNLCSADIKRWGTDPATVLAVLATTP